MKYGLAERIGAIAEISVGCLIVYPIMIPLFLIFWYPIAGVLICLFWGLSIIVAGLGLMMFPFRTREERVGLKRLTQLHMLRVALWATFLYFLFPPDLLFWIPMGMYRDRIPQGGDPEKGETEPFPLMRWTERRFLGLGILAQKT